MKRKTGSERASELTDNENGLDDDVDDDRCLLHLHLVVAVIGGGGISDRAVRVGPLRLVPAAVKNACPA